MQYGSGQYDIQRVTRTCTPAPRVRPEAIEIAQRHQGNDMRRCLDVPKQPIFGRQTQSLNVSQTRGTMLIAGVKGPIPVDPTYNGGKYSNRSVGPVPRVKPEAQDIANKARGTMDVNLGQYGKPDPMMYGESRGVENINPKEGPMRKVGIKGPILVDPIYNKGQYSGRSARPVPRVRSEASEIAEKSKGCIQNLLKTPDVRTFKHAKPKKQPTDHSQANVNRMRQIQRQSRQREREKEENKPTPVKALWRSTRYDDIESKVKTMQTQTPRAPRYVPPRPKTAPPGRNTVTNDHGQGDEPLTPKRAAQKRADDFIARNARLAKTYKPQRSKSQMEIRQSMDKYDEGLKKYKQSVKGTVPNYLQSRQREWAKAEQQRIRNTPDPTVPEGHTVLPDKDRKETLKVLKEIKESTRIKEKYYIQNGELYANEEFTRNDEPVLFEQKKKYETVEKTKYFFPNHSYQYQPNDQHHQQWEYEENVQPELSYSDNPYETFNRKSAQQKNAGNQKFVYDPREPYDTVDATLYSGTRGKLHASYFDPIVTGYAEYPTRDKILTPTKYRGDRRRYSGFESMANNQGCMTPVEYGRDDDAYYELHSPALEYSPLRYEAVPVVATKVEASDFPTKLTHHDKDKKSKNYTKFVEGIGYRKYETGTKTSRKSSKFTEEYSPEVTQIQTYIINEDANDQGRRRHYNDNYHANYRSMQDNYKELDGYVPNDDTAQYITVDHHGQIARDDSAKQMMSTMIHHPPTHQHRPMTSQGYRPVSQYGYDNVGCYSDRPGPPNDAYYHQQTERSPRHVTFARTTDVRNPTPPGCRANSSLSARLSAASATSTYQDQFKNPVSHNTRFESGADHKARQNYYKSTDSYPYVQPTLLEYANGRLI